MALMHNAPASPALDLAGGRRRPGRLGWLVLVLGIAALVSAVLALRADRAELAEQEAVVEGQRQQARAARRASAPTAGAASPQVLEPALAVADALRVPWSDAFTDVANARADGVALLELHADAGQGVLRLVGHARSLDIAFEYVTGLQVGGALREVRIDAHEWVSAGDGDLVRFVASARWGSGR